MRPLTCVVCAIVKLAAHANAVVKNAREKEAFSTIMRRWIHDFVAHASKSRSPIHTGAKPVR